MQYYQKTVEQLKSAKLEDYNFTAKSMLPDLWNLFSRVRKSVRVGVWPEQSPFMYYEKTIGANRILGFRMPETNSFLIYRCIVKVKKGIKHYYVSILGINGQEAMDYLRASARLVIPFFRAIEEHLELSGSVSSMSIVDMRTGKYRRKDLTREELDYLGFSLESEKIELKKGSK